MINGRPPKDPSLSKALSDAEGQAAISRRARYSLLYVLREQETRTISKIILPVHGYGLWSILYGFFLLRRHEYRFRYYFL